MAALQPIRGDVAPARRNEIAAALRQYQHLSMLIGGTGLLVQTFGLPLGGVLAGGEEAGAVLGLALFLLGTGMVIVGLGYYALARGRSWAWGFCGLLSWLGLFLLVGLRKQCLNCGTLNKTRYTECQDCSAPLGA